MFDEEFVRRLHPILDDASLQEKQRLGEIQK